MSDIVRAVDKVLPFTKKDIGSLVRYYDQGYYHGYLVKINSKTVTIQPIGAKGGVKPHTVDIELSSVSLVKET
jgi:hypothetical protein